MRKLLGFVAVASVLAVGCGSSESAKAPVTPEQAKANGGFKAPTLPGGKVKPDVGQTSSTTD